METVTVSPKYQVVIPASIRNSIGIHPGEKIVVIEKDGVIHLVRIQGISNLRGIFSKINSEGIRDENDRYAE
ncbi:MAG: AbrB/MazE/SpoVT family DNA-binding domain-containing protein [Candidatus Thermoplasmatota archaeon]|nr:AbrB/MazE/SpoVT family DNA-binding domain-containing protein [Candidatus Thermoplasmatota archaeon]